MANKQDYIRYITLLNYDDATGEDEGWDFFWKNWNISDWGGISNTFDYSDNPSDYSWIVPYNSRGNAEPSLVVDSYSMRAGMTASKLTATITTSEKGVDLVLNTSNGTGSGCLPQYNFFTFEANETDGLYTSTAKRVNEYTFWHYWIWCAPSMSDYSKHFDTLEACFVHLTYNVRNINIIVDSEDWTERTPAYNWQSVPSISGKNGILNLSTLNDVNDGEPVETSDISKFNLTDDSNVSALVAAHFSQ